MGKALLKPICCDIEKKIRFVFFAVCLSSADGFFFLNFELLDKSSWLLFTVFVCLFDCTSIFDSLSHPAVAEAGFSHIAATSECTFYGFCG